LFDKIRTLEKIVGPEYVALIEGIEDISENDPAEFFVGIWGTRQAVYEVSLKKTEGTRCHSRYRWDVLSNYGSNHMAKKRKARKTKRKRTAKRRKRTRILGVPIPTLGR
jgi:hypothetical protein